MDENGDSVRQILKTASFKKRKLVPSVVNSLRTFFRQENCHFLLHFIPRKENTVEEGCNKGAGSKLKGEFNEDIVMQIKKKIREKNRVSYAVLAVLFEDFIQKSGAYCIKHTHTSSEKAEKKLTNLQQFVALIKQKEHKMKKLSNVTQWIMHSSSRNSNLKMEELYKTVYIIKKRKENIHSLCDLLSKNYEMKGDANR
ncbi:hypothetical protein LOAG_01936 [Loa loa]|uniref:Uncharacterized protein n=1 Tax=Loa loa TaxID=7209 RepID=A0A1S0U8A8_LOALO|nr:hypothetical protein LOAG_01936 [Loa loa]EFO26544.1 hypothetical protein LOAG_01936 [Loa loa]